MLKSLTKSLNKESLELTTCVINFMIDVVTGPCKQNQVIMIENKVVDSCKDIIRDLDKKDDEGLKSRGIYLSDSTSVALINITVEKTVTLLRALLENNSEDSLAKNIGSSITFDRIFRRVEQIYLEYFTRYLKINPKQLLDKDPRSLVFMIKSKEFDSRLTEAFNLFIFLLTVNDRASSYEAEIMNNSGIGKAAYDFFESNTGHIEIVFEGEVQKIYFIKHPACNYLSQNSMDEVMGSVRRENQNQKISDFVNSS